MSATLKHILYAEGKWGKNFTKGRKGPVKYIVLHHTATLASALDNLEYFASRYVGASAHYFIDLNGDISKSVREQDIAWSVGAKRYVHPSARNSNTINIEMVSKGTAFTPNQIKSLKILVHDVAKRHGIKLSNSTLLRHHDVTGKNCPGYYGNDARWAILRKQLMEKPIILPTVTAVKPKAPVVPKPTPAPVKHAVPQAKSKPKKPTNYYPKYKGRSESIVEALRSIRVGTSFGFREKIARANGIKHYEGTASQNEQLLKLLKAGKLKKA